MRNRIKTAKPRRSTAWRKCLCGISLGSLLCLGWQHLEEANCENAYCTQLQYFLLDAYESKHGEFPTSLDDVEGEYEAHMYNDSAGYSPRARPSIREAYRTYNPVITEIDRSGPRVRIRVQFAGRFHNVYTVYQM